MLAPRLVASAGRRADADPRESPVACANLTPRTGRDEHVPSRLQLDRVAVNGHRSLALEHEVDLFLTARRLVVVAAGRAGRKVELVDAERRHTESSSHASCTPFVHGLDLVGVERFVGHPFNRNR